MRVRRYLCAGVLVAAALTSGCDRGTHPRQIGKPAPEFTLTDSSRSVDLAQFRGHVVVLNFWGPWCPPCLEELPSLMAMQRQMPQLTVLAIGVPAPGQDPKEGETVYRNFIAAHQVNLLTMYDGPERINAMYGTVQFPETYIIDKRGVLRRKFVSEQDWTSPDILKYLSALANDRS